MPTNRFAPLNWLGSNQDYLLSQPIKDLTKDYHSKTVFDQIIELTEKLAHDVSQCEVIKLEIERRFKSKSVADILKILLDVYIKIKNSSQFNLKGAFDILTLLAVNVIAKKLSSMSDIDFFKEDAAHWQEYQEYDCIEKSPSKPDETFKKLISNINKIFKTRVQFFINHRKICFLKNWTPESAKNQIRYTLANLNNALSLRTRRHYEDQIGAINEYAIEMYQECSMYQSSAPAQVDAQFPAEQPLGWTEWIMTGIFNYTLSPLWSVYNHTLGYILNPMAIGALISLDYIRCGFKWASDKVMGRAWAGLVLSGLGSGTSFIGVYASMQQFFPSMGDYFPLGMGIAGVTVQTGFNYLSSKLHKAHETQRDPIFLEKEKIKAVLTPFTLNMLFIVVGFASVASGMLAKSAPNVLVNTFAGEEPSDDILITSMISGYVLGFFNALISLIGGYSSNVKFFQETIPRLKNDLKHGRNYILFASFIFMVTCLSFLVTYSEPIARQLSKTEGQERTWSYITVLLGAGIANTLTMVQFFNPAYDFIHSVAGFGEKRTNGNILLHVCTSILFAPFYIFAFYGNGYNGAASMADMEAFSLATGVSAGLAATPVAIQSVRALADLIYDRYKPKAEDLDTLL
jgi:hypothetical protein